VTPEALAAMLDDDELETRAAELADDLRQCEAAIDARVTWHEAWDTDRAHFRAVWRALRVIRAEQRRRHV
jgi:predicted transcriptional regulator